MAVDRRRLWRIVRIVWITLGIGAVFLMWFGMSAAGLPPGTLTSDGRVEIVRGSETIDFRPRPDDAARAGLIFFPGGMVQPEAYAPMARALAERGHAVVIVRLPFRVAPTPAYQEMTFETARETMRASPRRWVVGGHSRGGMLASRFAAAHPLQIAGLALVGTTHPREIDLSQLPLCVPVVKIYGTRDGVAEYEDSVKYRSNLPSHTGWVDIEGGNHTQFGYYRYQLGDRKATISREVQQAQLIAGLEMALQPQYTGLPPGSRPPCPGQPTR